MWYSDTTCWETTKSEWVRKPVCVAFIYVDENGEKWNARSYDFFMVFPGKLPEYARMISIYENAESFYGSNGSNPFNWEGIHINNLHPEEEW